MTGSGLASCASYWQNSDAPASRERSSISSLRGNRAFTPVFDGLWRRSNPEPCRSLDCFAALAMTSVLPPLPATRGGKKNGDTDMPSPHNKRSDERKFLKRRSAEQGLAEVDAAHLATHRLYCETLKFWRRCGLVTCHRHRRCLGEPTGCLMRGLPFRADGGALAGARPSDCRRAAAAAAGHPRRMVPAPHRTRDRDLVGICASAFSSRTAGAMNKRRVVARVERSETRQLNISSTIVPGFRWRSIRATAAGPSLNARTDSSSADRAF
jgi:hypothetical protein